MKPKMRAALAVGVGLTATSTAFAADTTISFTQATWTDRAGVTHPAVNTNWDFYDLDTFSFNDFLGNAATDAAGTVTFTTTHDDPGSEIEFFAYLRAAIPGIAHIKPSHGGIFGATEPYRWLVPSSGTLDITEGDSATYAGPAVDNVSSNNIGTAIGMVQAFGFIGSYYNDVHAANLPFVTVVYNSSITQTAYYGSTPRIEVSLNHWAAWDVLMHEYGHHIATVKGFDTSGGGPHAVGGNNITPFQQGPAAQPGAALAWSEGVATHLGMMAIHHGNLAGQINGLPAQDVNSTYDNYLSNNSFADETHLDFRYSNENKASNSFGGIPQGEGDEWSTSLVLWDLYDSGASNGNAGNENFANGFSRNDQASFGATRLFTLLDTANPTTFRDLWHAAAAEAIADPTLVGLVAGANRNLVLGTLGEILQEANISCVPSTIGLRFDERPVLSFFERNGDRSGDYAFVLLDSSFNLVTSTLQANVLDFIQTHSWQINVPLVAGQQYWWAVLNTSALYNGVEPSLLTDIDKWYWSGLNPIHYELVPEPGSLGVIAFAMGAAALRRRRIEQRLS